MSIHDLSPLYELYPQIIGEMPLEFKSHYFIQKLAEANQSGYIEALYAYRENGRPFLSVHAQLAKKLTQFPDLVTSIGEGPSEDVFGNANRCEYWRKVGG